MEFYCKTIKTSYSKMYEQNYCVAEIEPEDFCKMVMNNIEMLRYLENQDRDKLLEFLK
jgi:hypothetical protein